MDRLTKISNTQWLLFITFLALKLLWLTDWSWIAVTAPLWMTPVIFLVIINVMAVGSVVGDNVTDLRLRIAAGNARFKAQVQRQQQERALRRARMRARSMSTAEEGLHECASGCNNPTPPAAVIVNNNAASSDTQPVKP